MKSIITKIVLLSFLVFLFLPNISHAAPERRIALVIGNSNYTDGRLNNPVNDATDIAAALKSLGFTVTLRKDADLREMKDEIDNFGNSLKKGGVGLFFYAGHGIQVGGINYLIPVRAKINNAKMVEHEALDVNRLLSILDNAGNSVNIVMLDACRDNPIVRSSRGAGRGLAFITRQPPGTLISYSTGANQVADDGDERNSPYTAALLQHIKTPGLPVEQVFKRVRNRVVEQTRGKQEPAEYTMLRKDFYFVPGSAGKSAAIVPVGKETEVNDALDNENLKLEAEQRRLEGEKAAFAKKKAIDEKRQQIAEEKERLEAEKEEARQAELERKQAKKTTTLAMAKRPASGETDRDGRFVAYRNGTVLDTRTNLMWAAKDNGGSINWPNAKSYCENYRGGGYSDWRMPTEDELAGLYDASKGYTPGCASSGDNDKVHLTNLITMSCWAGWASETRGSEATYFGFLLGKPFWIHQSDDGARRALPVRSGK